MADKRVKYIADDGPFCEVGITGKQTSWRRNQSGFVTEANAALLIASGKFVLSSTAFATDADGLDSHLAEHAALPHPYDEQFVIVGQSNADGRGSMLAADGAMSASPNVCMLTKGEEFTIAVEPIGQQYSGWQNNIPPDATSGIPAHSFGLAMGKSVAALTGVTPLLVPCAIGSTSYRQWLPPEIADDSTTLFGATTARAKKATIRGRPPVFCQFGHESNGADTAETLSTGAWTTGYVGKFTAFYNRLMNIFPGAYFLYAQLSAVNDTDQTASRQRRTGHAQGASEDLGGAVAPVQVALTGGTKLNENSNNSITVNSDGSFLMVSDGNVSLGYSKSGLTAGKQYLIEFTMTGTGQIKFYNGLIELLAGISAGSPYANLHSFIFTADTTAITFYRNTSGQAVNATIKILSVLQMDAMPLPRAHMIVTHDVLRNQFPDDMHVATAGHKEIGRRFALAYAEHVLGLPGIDGTGPRLVSITKTDATHTKVKFTQNLAAAKSGETNYGDGTNSLFRVYDDGTEKSVSSVAIDGSDATALIITHASCSGVRVITYGDRKGQNSLWRKGVVYNTLPLPLPAPSFGPVIAV